MIKNVMIKEVEKLMEKYDVEIDTPDGFQPIKCFVKKGYYMGYKCTNLQDRRFVIVNRDHLFETDRGWEYAKNLSKCRILIDTDKYENCEVIKLSTQHNIMDIEVDHVNHRYYANGFSGHNTGVGKTLVLCHLAANWLTQGCNVLYVTLEMAEERIAQRIDSNLLDVPILDLRDLSKELYDKRVAKMQQKVKGKLIVKEYPTASVHVGHLRHLLRELQLKKKFVPDVLILDYINLCLSYRLKTSTVVNPYVYVKSISEELRGLAVEKKIRVVSATQFNRTGFGSSDPGLEQTAESFGLPNTSDLMIAIISTEELENLNQFMFKQLKNRYNDITKNRRFVVGVDKSKMRLYDVEQTAQKNISESGQEDVSNGNNIAKSSTRRTRYEHTGGDLGRSGQPENSSSVVKNPFAEFKVE